MFPDNKPNQVTEPVMPKTDTVETPPVQSDTMPAAPVQPMGSGKKSRAKLVVVLSIVGVLLLAGIGFAIWCFAYKNSDAKILGDALNKTLTAEGPIAFDGTVTFTDKSSRDGDQVVVNLSYIGDDSVMQADVDFIATIDDTEIQAGASIIGAQDDMYIKLNGLDELISSISGESASDMGINLDNVSDQWIHISADTIDQLNQQSSSIEYEQFASCVNNQNDRVRNNTSMRDQFIDTVKDGDFFIAERLDSETVDGRDAYKYDLTVNTDNAQQFANQVMGTDLINGYVTCFEDLGLSTDDLTDDIDTSDFDTETAPDTTFSFWIDKKTHEPLRFNLVMGDDEAELVVDFDVNLSSDAAMPTAPTDYVEIEDVLEELFGVSLTDMMGSLEQSQQADDYYTDLESLYDYDYDYSY